MSEKNKEGALKPCPSPRCGVESGGIEGPELYGTQHGPGIVECVCGMRGPEGADSEEARELWNELPRTVAKRLGNEPTVPMKGKGDE